MSDFTVSIEGLTGLNKNLERAKENIDGALKAMEDIGPDSIGPDDLDEACAEFREDWQRGIGKIGEAVDKITEALGRTRDQYAELEEALNEGFTKMTDDIASGKAGMPEPPTMGPAPQGGSS